MVEFNDFKSSFGVDRMLKNYFKYLNVGPAEERWGMYVTSVGYARTEANSVYPREQHPDDHALSWTKGRTLHDYYVVFISKGRGLYGSAHTSPEEVNEGTCFFLYPGVRHRYKPDPKSGWEEYWVGFNGFYVERLMSNGFFDPQTPIIPAGLNSDILVLFRQLIDTVQASLPGYSQQIAATTMQLLGVLNQSILHYDHTDDPTGKLILKARFIMQESFEQSIDMEKLAASLPMGYSTFRKAFKQITGESPNQYHLNLRLERAKKLLSTTLLNTTEIADQTGFESVFYFSKLFKKKNGIPPTAYRKTVAID